MTATAIKLALHTLRVLWALFSPVDPQDVEGLRAFAPTHLTTPQAEEHFYAARLASVVHGRVTTVSSFRHFGANVRTAKIRANAHDLPDVQPELVDPAVDAALATETPAIPSELLLSIAWGESRFRPDQRTGVVCGALQVNPADIGEPRENCARWSNNTRLGFAAGVRELEMMLADRRVHGNLRLALLYRACGNAAFDGTCAKGRWPEWVLVRAAMIGGAATTPARKPSS